MWRRHNGVMVAFVQNSLNPGGRESDTAPVCAGRTISRTGQRGGAHGCAAVQAGSSRASRVIPCKPGHPDGGGVRRPSFQSHCRSRPDLEMQTPTKEDGGLAIVYPRRHDGREKNTTMPRNLFSESCTVAAFLSVKQKQERTHVCFSCLR